MTATLRGDGAVEGGVWGGAVKGCSGKITFKGKRIEMASQQEVYCQ